MQLDLRRWTRLVGEIEDLQEHAWGLSRRMLELDGRRQGADRELARLERDRPAAYGPRPRPEETPETARAKIREADEANRQMAAGLPPNARRPPDLSRRPVLADFDARWFQQKALVDEIDAERGRLAERGATLNGRLHPLLRLRGDIETWARQAGIQLPGDETERRSVRLPAAPQGVGEFGSAFSGVRLHGERR